MVNMFFIDQQKAINNCVDGNWTLQMPFTWSIKNYCYGSQTPLQAVNVNLHNLVHPQQRTIYVEPRMTT